MTPRIRGAHQDRRCRAHMKGRISVYPYIPKLREAIRVRRNTYPLEYCQSLSFAIRLLLDFANTGRSAYIDTGACNHGQCSSSPLILRYSAPLCSMGDSLDNPALLGHLTPSPPGASSFFAARYAVFPDSPAIVIVDTHQSDGN